MNLKCAFGVNLEDKELTFEGIEKDENLLLGPYMLKCFQGSFERLFTLQLILFPRSYDWYLSKSDRILKKNCLKLRNYFHEIINQRREEMKRADFKDKGDLLSTLLNEELYKSDDAMIVDECITFFFAGTQTTSITVSNLIMYCMNN